MSQGKVTSADVAARAGVSRSAVSRVFTPGASVSARTAEKVRQAASELGYRPNILARSLLTGKSRIIGLVVAYLDNHFYPTVLEKLSAALEARGYHVLMFMGAQDGPAVERVIENILAYQIDGLILASVALSSELGERCSALDVPVVLFNRREAGGNYSAVVSDNRAGGRMVAEHLLAGGHRRFAHVAGWEGASTQADREAGFSEVLKAAGHDYLRAVGDFHTDTARDAARQLFSGEDRPDAVFVSNDYMAFHVLDVLRFELGLRVPEDVSVAGFDDVPTAAWPSYDLTTVRQDADAMVRETVTLLLSSIESEVTPHQIELPTRLVLRGSTRPVQT